VEKVFFRIKSLEKKGAFFAEEFGKTVFQKKTTQKGPTARGGLLGTDRVLARALRCWLGAGICLRASCARIRLFSSL
jgi:hypothetical protein